MTFDYLRTGSFQYTAAMGFVQRALTRLQQFIDRPWYIYLVSLLAGLDLFIMIVPTDGLLISSILANRKGWVRKFLLVSFGSALGALLLSLLIQWDAQWITGQLFESVFQSETWVRTEGFIQEHGIWAMVIIALSFLPQQPAVILAALGGMPTMEIFVAVLLGRMIKYAVFAYLAINAPQVLGKLWVVRKEVREVESARKTQLEGSTGA